MHYVHHSISQQLRPYGALQIRLLLLLSSSSFCYFNKKFRPSVTMIPREEKIKLNKNENSIGHLPGSCRQKNSLLLSTGRTKKSNPLGKIWYLRNCSKFFCQIYSVYRGGFRPHILQISLEYLVAFENYNYLNLNVHFSK